MSPHFSEKVDKYIDEINSAGRRIELHFPKVWIIIQEWANHEIHPGAITEVLTQTVPYFENRKIKNPWAYLRGVMKTKRQNWREKDFIKDHEKREKFFKGLVEKMRRIDREMNK